MSSTFFTSQGLGAEARSRSCDARLVLGLGSFIEPSSAKAAPIAAIQANQAWMRTWHLEPAYSVKHTDRLIPRPLERSP